MKKKKTKKKIFIILALCIIDIALVMGFLFLFKEYRKEVKVVDRYIEKDKYIVLLNGEGSCLLGNEFDEKANN